MRKAEEKLGGNLSKIRGHSNGKEQNSMRIIKYLVFQYKDYFVLNCRGSSMHNVDKNRPNGINNNL